MTWLPLRASIVACLLSACTANLPALTDASGALDARCVGPFADQLVDSFPTTLANASAVLGAPDTVTATLATNDIITLGFIGLRGITDASGSDLRLHATFSQGATGLVRVAGPDMAFVFAGNISDAATEVDIAVAMLESATYVRIVGVTGEIQLDAVEAIHDACP